MSIITRPLGKTIPIRVFLREKRTDDNDGDLARMFGVTINITGPDESTTVTNGSLLYVEEGIALYHWDTSGLSEGTYKVESVVQVNNEGTQVEGKIYIRLTERYV